MLRFMLIFIGNSFVVKTVIGSKEKNNWIRIIFLLQVTQTGVMKTNNAFVEISGCDV